ncbi:N-6 DNA methylase [Mycobacterium sp. WMMD1722]|uniref:N-6 DNA methylase n=1 Tax=Mycobacterium sp. WMMD1722 TaxID=3404117 RepID=UPI003BF5D013
MTDRIALIDRLVAKTEGVRSEATIQSDVRMLLLDHELGLSEVQLEAQVGDKHRRIDVEVGCTVIEVKKSLDNLSAITTATDQLADYVRTRQLEVGQRYVGILTDGALWIAFHEIDGLLAEATRHRAKLGDAGAAALLNWLEGVLATKQTIAPTPDEIRDRLGASSSSHALDYATLKAIYNDHRNEPTVVLKRELWAKLLTSALGTQFSNTDELFLEHTLLVNSAEIIAHLVLDLKVVEIAPETLLSGDLFIAAGISGVVDRDFFDWIIEVPGGSGFISSLARRLARFDWSDVEHDVLKVLYESVISPEVRKSLGEYYTPDWLANRVVSEVVTDPVNQRVLDPSCGSGTFVFYAVRRFLNAAERSGLPLKEAMALVSSRVIGIDLHPVAVALARVTYLLALGRHRLAKENRGTLAVPIYLGDSLGWNQQQELLTLDNLTVPTNVGDQLFSAPLLFPNHLLADSARFDQIVTDLVEESGRAKGTNKTQLSDGTIRRLGLKAADLPVLNENFMRLKQLHEAEKNHIWSYYVRNISRPAWLAREENRVDCLVGNPPWLSYRYMTKEMQTEFKALSKARRFWHKASTATHQDLAGVFVACAVERYLKTGGRLGFVVPNSVIDRDFWAGFRSGVFDGAGVRFDTPWDLRRIRPHMFPRGSAVIFGTRTPDYRTMPEQAVVWRGRAPMRHVASEDAIGLAQALEPLTIAGADDDLSPYHFRFSTGATLFPRTFVRVQEVQAPLGVPSGSASIRSRRSSNEKTPWKDLPDYSGTVERQFLHPVYMGEHVVPFRTLAPDTFVLPLTPRGEVLDLSESKIDAYQGLAKWMRNVDDVWRQKSSGNMSFTERLDYMGDLTNQLPAGPIRVAYPSAGMHVHAAIINDPRIVIDYKLYWCAVATESEAHYLTGILNAPILTALVRPLMSYGKDERDVCKQIWKLPIPDFDPSDHLHMDISQLSQDLTELFSQRELVSDNYVQIRQDFRSVVKESEQGRRLDKLVRQLLGEPDESEEVTVPQAGLIRLTTGKLDLAADVEIDIDLEHDSDGRPYLWGYLVTVNGESTYTSIGSADADFTDRDLAGQFVVAVTTIARKAVDDGLTCRIFHYGSTETRLLNKVLSGRHAGLLDITTDLLSVIRQHYFSGIGYSLKRLAPEAGFTWRTPSLTGAGTLELIEQARAGDKGAWGQIVEYNEDDTRALHALRAHLR